MAAEPAGRAARYVFVTDGVDSPAPRFAWRLDAANNRPLGRGLGTHASLAACQESLDALRAAGAGLLETVSFDAANGLWTWRLTGTGTLTAVSARTYLRRFECRRAVTQFREAVAVTDPRAGVVRVTSPGALSRYAPEGAAS